ncbi:hypothetical protein GALMADRAFT_241276 [Galerina marginata CBS 339.88]|uniref:histidine kinase n=1 Tax=Galerina marginata (strain CBS 339.88) TaxID=685588 RepID=A0A067TC66_GALM3|nr:hypothetical protein GALMADRAFT_241276 [Galerina marginata CBS 339.88]
MPQWLHRLFASNHPPQWIEEHLTKPSSLTVSTDKDIRDSTNLPPMATPTTSTAIDHSLPPPVLQSSAASQSRRRKKSARINGLSVHWARFKKRLGTGTAPSSSSQIGESAAEHSYTRRMEMSETSDYVDEVVVDRTWTDEIKSSISHSEHGGSPEKSGGSHPPERASDHDSIIDDGFWNLSTPLTILRYRTWPFIMEIFSSRFLDEKAEEHYAQESWFLKKSLAIWASLWLIVNWVLGCIFIPHNPIVQLDKIFYFGVAPLLSFPIVFMVMYDWPRDRPYTYQVFLIVSIWCWSFYQVIFIIVCGFYTLPANHNHCGTRDFLGLFYYTTALQTIALFGLRLNRFPAAMGALIFFLFSSIAIIPHKTTWGRSMINFFVFQSFLIYVHYVRESSERRLYTLRDQLKIQFKATQKAQINERKAADSKRRLTSYVFHEVRVPLNTALLAVQNMEASGTVARDQEIEFNALCGSLSMMSKVLNDVLDFNRMDSGKFESMSRPYGFHQVMKSLFVPLQLATDARGLKFEIDLDGNIDKVARIAAYKSIGETSESIRKHIQENPDVGGVVTGDETRLRQIITNLASNACKFTPSGGKLSIKTRLVMPSLPPEADPLADFDANDVVDVSSSSPRPLSADYLTQHNILQSRKPPPPLEWIVVRIEVQDTGYGIKPQDMAQSKLFSAFNQTEQGRQQGGKGTGLGLALVRQIVKLSGGRLGVQSKIGEGSTFWVELPLGVGERTFITGPPDLPDGSSSSDLDTLHRTGTRLRKSCGPNVNMAVDAASLRASRKLSTIAQTNAAMQGIMDQGGLVELVLRKRDYDAAASPTVARLISNPLLASEAGGGLLSTSPPPVDTPEPPQQPSKPPEEPPDRVPNVASFSESELTPVPLSSPAESSRATPVQRPTYVKLPSPKKFAMDDPDLLQMPSESTSNSLLSTSSEKSFNNLKMFDNNFTRGSPSASFTAVNIEPGLPVLVVDDDQLTRTLMKRILTRLGCQVSTAENGEVALEMILGQRVTVDSTPSSDSSGNAGPILEQQQEPQIFLEGKFAVVFLDNQMPVMSGLKVVEKMRQLGRTDFIVGVTGNALLSDQEEYLDAGVDRVLTKPVLERSLRDILVMAEEKRKGQQPQEQPPEGKAKTPPP